MASDPLTPPNPDFERAVREMFAGQPFMRHIGARLVSAAPGRSEIHLPFRSEVTQHDAYYHGGIIAMLSDMAGGCAVYTLLPAGQRALTVEFKVNIIAPGQGEMLVARGQVVRAGRTLIVCRSDVSGVRGGEETACAACLMTLMTVPR